MLKNVDHFLATIVVLPASAFLIQNDSGEKYLKDPFFIHFKKIIQHFSPKNIHPYARETYITLKKVEHKECW